jgi:NTP pyrophosphatase (non-canonical NTP hydrolase)
MTGADSLTAFQAEVRAFAEERDWIQFHDPKSLILALVGEVGELAELFQWIPADEACAHFAVPERKARAAEEMSDVLIYLVSLAEVLDIDLLPAAATKLADSRRRFPAGEIHGVAPRKD